MPVRGDDLKAKKELVIQKVQEECCRQRGLRRLEVGDAGMCCWSGRAPRRVDRGCGDQVGSCRTGLDVVNILDSI